MSAPRFAKTAAGLRDAVLEAAWVQWQALGAQGAQRTPSSMVDPEALVLASLALKDDEPRLWDFLHGFAGLGSRLLSVQRLQGMVRALPPEAGERLADFARVVTAAGRDPRWRRLAGGGRPAAGRAGKLTSPLGRLTQPAGLMLRLRAGMGVDVRTDTIAYLLGRGEQWCEVSEIAAALGYAASSVRVATDALVAARFVVADGARPRRCYAGRLRWGALLGEGGGQEQFAPWLPWRDIYAFALHLSAWAQTTAARAGSEELAASLARDFVESRGAVLTALRIDTVNPRAALPAGYGNMFSGAIGSLAKLVRERV
ncbi:MAG: hypothetical protein A2085_00440 [Gemmatimonadetes bacterium GWC2_71_10]|nr:MAG: hypothetical protein A2085_00440 [Gemmatimonadetes bacterium GWC2_71_10]